MTIDQRRYVDIASGVVGATAVALQKLDQRVFTPSPLIASTEVLEFTGADAVSAFFGSGSQEARYATAYFSYTSPAPVSRPKAIQFAAHRIAERAPTLRGAPPSATLAQIHDLGQAGVRVSVTVAGTVTQHTAEVDFTAPTSFAGVANALTAAFADFEFAPTFVFSNDGPLGAFVATFPATVEGASFPTSVAADDLGLAAGVFDIGGAPQTMAEAYLNSIRLTDSFGSAVFLEQGDLEQVVEVAELNASYNVKHQLHISVSMQEAEEYSAALIGIASVGLNITRPGDAYPLGVLPGAIMSATDYSRTNATTNYMYRQAGFAQAPQVVSDLEANILDPLRVNYYGRTASAGSIIDFYQRGFLCGGVSAPVDMSVHANEQWLKAYITQQWLTVLLSTRGVPANSDGEARMRLVIADTITQALNNGTILPGKRLTPAQIIAVTDASGDDLAWHDVQDKGYWFNVQIIEKTGPSNLPEEVGQYTLIYGKGDWVRKVEGSHNLV